MEKYKEKDKRTRFWIEIKKSEQKTEIGYRLLINAFIKEQMK